MLLLCLEYNYSIVIFFFFSSRRRHTRWNCDWSSDVCSSDLAIPANRCVLVRGKRVDIEIVQPDMKIVPDFRADSHEMLLAEMPAHLQFAAGPVGRVFIAIVHAAVRIIRRVKIMIVVPARQQP